MADNVQDALVAAATAAGRAPSIHNTQPWRWVVHGDTLDLHADRRRQLDQLDTAGHLLLVSRGTALHHARLALTAQGRRHDVTRPADGPLARIRITGQEPPDPAAMRRFQATLVRRTDRRPVTTEPVDPDALAAVIAAIEAEGERLHLLRAEQVLEVAATVDRAMRDEGMDQRQRSELARWVGGNRPDGTGIPDAAIPRHAPQTTVPGRDFGIDGTLPTSAGHDTAAVYAVLYGPGDGDTDWLRAGEALSAGWLTAVDHGLAVLPIGAADPDHHGPAHTPRLPADQVIEVTPV